MDNKTKAEIITEFTVNNITDNLYADFFDYNDLGVPMAVALKGDLVIFTDEGEKLFQETWKELCKLFGNNPDDDFEDYDEFIGDY